MKLGIGKAFSNHVFSQGILGTAWLCPLCPNLCSLLAWPHPYNPLLAAAQTKAEDSKKRDTFTRLFCLNWCDWQLVFSCCN